jgi:Trk K+ transport system NAD-binding subunit
MKLPQEFLIILIVRDKEFITPNGGITLLAGDTLIVLSDKESFSFVEQKLSVKNNHHQEK